MGTGQADAVGNLFRSARASDRHYGSGGRLLSGSEGSVYRYDAEGNLIEKVLPNRGGSWQYGWDGAGQLVSVKRPDGYSVQLSYDALGRRTGKHYRGKTTNWLWNGDKRNAARPLHEQAHYTVGREAGSVEELITWLFEEDSFAPLAKLTPAQSYSVVSDHLGTPLELHDGAGRTVWGAQLDSYGQARQGVGKASDCPFRYQGQYEDSETGLYYNRFRYYSPQEGMYISQDPIGLWGGNHLYTYVSNPNRKVDPFGLEDRIAVGDAGHHVPSVRKSRGRPFEVERSNKTRPTIHFRGSDPAHDHWRLHEAERDHVGPRQGAFHGTDEQLFDAYRRAYDPITGMRVDVRSPNGTHLLGTDVTPRQAVDLIQQHLANGGC